MKRRFFPLIAVVALLTGVLALPAPAAIHEIVSSHCAGHDLPNKMANVDPPGQLKDGQSFLRALQATGVYDVRFGVSQAGATGLDLTTEPPTLLEELPGPVAGTAPVTVFVDNTRPNAKLGDTWIWGYFPDPHLGVTVYIQLYDLDHPSFDHCTNLHP